MRGILYRIGDFFAMLGRGIARVFRAIGRFGKRHKKLSVCLLILVVGASVTLGILVRMRANGTNIGFSMPETTMLAKMDLEMTVTATGTLQSSNTHEVSSELSYNVAEIFVKEGDRVEAGQALAQLNTTDLDNDITELRKNIADAEETDALAISQAERKLQDAQNQLAIDQTKLQTDIDAASAAKTAAHNTFYPMVDEYTRLANVANAAKTTLDATPKADPSLPDDDPVNAAYKAALDAYNGAVQAADSYKSAVAYTQAESASSAADTTLSKAVEQYNTTIRQDNLSIENARDSLNNQKLKDSAAQYRTQLEGYLNDKDKCLITAPVAGTVTAMTAKVGSSAGGTVGTGASTGTTGSSATSGSGLFTIEDVNRLEIPVSVAEYDAIGIQTGMNANITSDAVEDKVWKATVSSISAKATDGYFTVTVALASPVDELVIGMSATVDIVTETRQDVYAMPYDAVVTNAAGQTVVYALEMGGMDSGGATGGLPREEMPEGGFPEGEMPDGEFSQETDGGRPNFDAANAASGQDGTSTQNRIEIVVETGLETDYYIEISGEDLHDGLMILNDPLGNTVTAIPSDAASGGMGGLGGFGGGMGAGGMGGGPPR